MNGCHKLSGGRWIRKGATQNTALRIEPPTAQQTLILLGRIDNILHRMIFTRATSLNYE